jgi:hypothetical protein
MAMTYKGHVENGVVVLDEPAQLPEGTEVEVDLLSDERQGPTMQAVLLKYAGCMSGLPADFAENHDHYIHGTPKK